MNTLLWNRIKRYPVLENDSLRRIQIVYVMIAVDQVSKRCFRVFDS